MTGPIMPGETHKSESKRITIDPITRLEGHGKIEIFLDDVSADRSLIVHDASTDSTLEP